MEPFDRFLAVPVLLSDYEFVLSLSDFVFIEDAPSLPPNLLLFRRILRPYWELIM